MVNRSPFITAGTPGRTYRFDRQIIQIVIHQLQILSWISTLLVLLQHLQQRTSYLFFLMHGLTYHQHQHIMVHLYTFMREVKDTLHTQQTGMSWLIKNLMEQLVLVQSKLNVGITTVTDFKCYR